MGDIQLSVLFATRNGERVLDRKRRFARACANAESGTEYRSFADSRSMTFGPRTKAPSFASDEAKTRDFTSGICGLRWSAALRKRLESIGLSDHSRT